MTDFLFFLTACCVVIAILSVAYDDHTYERRQDEWERDHPGDTYIPGYKRTMRKQTRMMNKNGVL